MIRHFRHLPQVHLKPGELHVTDVPSLVTTVLGSCVSITLHSERDGLSAICHAMLPEAKGDDPGMAFRYVDESLAHMLDRFEREGVRRPDIQVKLFGGADVIRVEDRKPGAMTVGRMNLVTAQESIRKEGLVLSASDIGGTVGRKLLFVTESGMVLVKKLERWGKP
jgi:chemotaxis protein CheD